MDRHVCWPCDCGHGEPHCGDNCPTIGRADGGGEPVDPLPRPRVTRSVLDLQGRPDDPLYVGPAT